VGNLTSGVATTKRRCGNGHGHQVIGHEHVIENLSVQSASRINLAPPADATAWAFFV
jgi:hypothetical protein